MKAGIYVLAWMPAFDNSDDYFWTISLRLARMRVMLPSQTEHTKNTFFTMNRHTFFLQ